MAISAVAVTTTDTLETFRVEFNNLVADVASIEQVGASNIIISDGGNIGSASDLDAMSIAANGVVTYTQPVNFSGGLVVSNLDIDGATDISAAIVDADLFIVDDGASGTNRKTAASRIKTYIADVTLTTAAQTAITSVGTLTALDVDNININGNTISASSGAVNITPAGGSAIVLDGTVNVDAGVVTGVTSLTSNNILIADDGTIGSASDTDAIAIAANGVVTFSAGIAGTLTTAAQTNITSLGTLTALTVDDITIDGSTISDAGDFALDISGDIILDANGADIIFKDNGTEIGRFTNSSTDLVMQVTTQDKDIIFKGDDGGSGITALTLDMSNAGGAIFNSFLKSSSYFWSNTDDGQVLRFGTSAEIQVHHVHNAGLTFKNTVADTDNRPFVLQLKSEEDAIVADDVIASIEMAAGDSDGTDGATVAAGIHAIAEDTFSASANATKLVFTTGVSETAASSATAKMTLSSAGLLTIADDFMLKDGGTIGVASTNDAITISSAGIVTFKDDIIIKDGGTIGSASDTDAITISSGGVVTISATTATTSVSNGALVVGGGVGIGGDIRLADDLVMGSDSSRISFGGDSEITMTHVHDVGLTLTHFVTGGNKPFVLQLKSEEDAIVADDVIASIEMAAGDSDGTDGATVAAGIHAIAEGTFSASANATKLVFTTGVSETAAASATAKMTLSSAGLLTIADDFVIKDGGTIGSASDTDAIAISSGGVVTISATTANTSTSDGALVVGGGAGIGADLTVGDDLRLQSDGALLFFGAGNDVKLGHDHNSGLSLTNIDGTDGASVTLTLKNSETDIEQDDVIGAINFQSPLEATGTDAILVSAGIEAVSEGDFSSSNNATKLSFKTAASETATEKMSLSSAGLLTIADDFVIKDGGTIGSTTTPGAITVASNGAVTTSTNLNIGGQIIGQSHLQLDVDYAQIFLGEDQDVTITHYPDSGFTVSNTATGDNKPITITLENKEDDISVDETIGQIHFRAAGEDSGTDAVLIAATIAAVSEGDFSASNNATKLSFRTAASEIATEKMSLSSTGLLTIADDFMIKDGGTIGVASTNDAITISSAGIVTFKDDIIIKDGGTIGVASAATAITIASTGIVTFVDDIIIKDGGTIGSASDTDAISISSGGVVTMDQIPVFSAGINVSGGTIAGTLATAAQTNITSLGTLTALTVDDINLNGKVITITGDTSDTFTITAGAAGATTLATTDAAGTGGNLTLDADGKIILDADNTGGFVEFHDGGSVYGSISQDSNNMRIRGAINSGDVIIQGLDSGGSLVNSAQFDMSDSGALLLHNNMKMASDGAILKMGLHNDVTLTHVADSGVTLTNTTTGDNTPVVFQLKSSELIVVADEVIASIEMAAGDASGTDAATVAAGIHAIAEDTFTSSANPTKLVFTTGVSETAASSATAKMTLSSAGLLTIADDFMIKDGGTIGVASTNDAITISSAGIVTFKDDIIIKDGGTIGSASATDAITIASSGDVTLTGASGNIVFDKSDNALEFADNVKAVFGAGNDLQLYHDSNNSIIKHVGTGSLLFYMDSELAIQATPNSLVRLYHNNVAKLETTAAGATITGELLTTGFSSADFAAAKIVMNRSATDGTDAGDNIIDETDSDNMLMENVTSWVTSGFTIRDSFGNHLQTVNGVS